MTPEFFSLIKEMLQLQRKLKIGGMSYDIDRFNKIKKEVEEWVRKAEEEKQIVKQTGLWKQ